MDKRKIFLLAFIIFILGINSIAYGKYVIDYVSTVAKIDIDRTPPKITILEMNNTNTNYEAYANKTHTLTAKIKVIEKNIVENNFNTNNVKILVNKQVQENKIISINKIEEKQDYIIYEVILENILGDGILEIKVNEGTIVDKSNNINEETILATGIKIDNTPPETTFKQKLLESGKVNANITANEGIRAVEGWNISDDKKTLNKEFPSNTSYIFEVTDFAQNTSEVNVKITQATYLNLSYGSYSSSVNWSWKNEENGMCGENQINISEKAPIELMILKQEGTADTDYIRARAYIYTYWGEGSQAISDVYEYRYNHGYKPSENSYSIINKSLTARLDGKYWMFIGAENLNKANKKDMTHKKAIPEEIAKQKLYGISALALDLKDYSEYSIIYQIYVKEKGWLEAVSDGEETKLALNKPITAYRITIVPKSEKKYVLNMWNKNIGTNNTK